MSPQNLFSGLRFAPAAAALAALLPASGLADSVDATVTNLVTKQIVVQSNGSSYHNVSHLANLVADVRIQVDTETVGRVKSWKIWLALAGEESGSEDYPTFGKSKSYDVLDRPRRVDRTERLIVPSTVWKSFVLARCNELADDLRAQGLGNTAIFNQDRKLPLAVVPRFDADTSGAGSNYFVEGTPWSLHKKTELVCKKWSGASIPQASTDLSAVPAKVVNKGLSIYEQYGAGGLCKIRLDGWITTDRKNTEVSFRYRNQEGKTSEVWTVNTGDNRTATFSHWYDIKDNGFSESGIRLAETGFIRMIGVSHDFRSDWAEYTMECVEGGPDTLVANDPPKLTMQVVEQGKVMVHGRLCPERLKLVGLLEGRGNFSGQVAFFGPGYLSPPQNYTITHDQKLPFGADVELDWSDTPPPSPHGPMGQWRKFGMSVTNGNNVSIASIPPQSHFLQCRGPRLNPAVTPQGGLTVAPRNPASAAQQSGQAAVAGQLALQRLPGFAIQAPSGQLRRGEIRLSGGKPDAGYVLRFFRKGDGGYQRVRSALLPNKMKGTTARFKLSALTGGRDWRLEVCPAGRKDKKACKTSDFRLPAAKATGKTSAPGTPQGTKAFIVPGLGN